MTEVLEQPAMINGERVIFWGNIPITDKDVELFPTAAQRAQLLEMKLTNLRSAIKEAMRAQGYEIA